MRLKFNIFNKIFYNINKSLNKIEQMNLLGKNIKELETLCEINNLPKFHGMQLFRWLYNKSNLNIAEMTNVPEKLKNIIRSDYRLSSLKVEKKMSSNQDETTKYLFEDFKLSLKRVISI